VPEPATLIGPYRLITQLGRGAMGEVWRARDERLDRYVALKILPADAAGDIERRSRMLREARAAAAIRHPNVVTLFDVVEHEGDDVLVMEIVEGRTLSEVLRKDGAAPLERGLRWIESIADALVAAHTKQILHRDIKAANVMLADGDHIKVLDFGLAKLLRDDEPAVKVAPIAPSASETKIALDETMPSAPATGEQNELDSYKTHAGQLIGTPLYMAPEQIDGSPPDEQTEVFSVGVLAHEILAGKPPYTAASMEELFRQIQKDPAPVLDVPEPVREILRRALEKDPAKRFASMAELRDAVVIARKRLFAPPVKKWPFVAALLALVVGSAVGLWWLRGTRPEPLGPGDAQVQRALDEYELFYNDKAISSLRAALRIAPEHPRANAYIILFGAASDADRTTAIAAGKRALPSAKGKRHALLAAALALVERGPAAAAATLSDATDRELRFWRAELQLRAGDFDAAAAGYKALLEDATTSLRGRIYDHYSFLLLGLDDTAEAKRIGALYRDAFPGEADAIGVYATTLSAAGEHDAAVAAAEEALRLAEGEDTYAGLAKVLAYKGDRSRAKDLYERSLLLAGPARKPLRRAALALLQFADGDLAKAKDTVAPCLAPSTRGGPPGSGDAASSSAASSASESTVRERGACLFVAGILDPSNREIAEQLDELAAAATPQRPAYGKPAALATLVRARATFFGGACLVATTEGTPPADDTAYRVPLDFYVAYHVPFFATWATCERAAMLAAKGDNAGARALLEPRAASRWWLRQTIERYR
jgi:tetratricopeptide (TPR) repeat protein